MYSERHARKRNKINHNKLLVLLAALLLIFTVGIGSTLAYLITSTAPVVNTFEPSNLSGNIDEDFNYTIKEDVKVKNSGDIPAYIRAAIVVNWLDDEGNIVPEAVVNGDYTMDLGNGWKKLDDGYYYYTDVVSAGGSTANLINRCEVTPAGKAKGYRLSVEILAQGVQTEPEQAVFETWGVNVSQFISSSN